LLQSIKRAKSLDPTDPNLHTCIVKFYKALKVNGEINEHVRTVIDRETEHLFGGRDADAMNQDVLSKFSNSFHHVLQVARCMYELDATKRNAAVQLVMSFDFKRLTLEDATLAYSYFTNGVFGACESSANDYKMKCQQRFLHALLFKDLAPCENHLENSNLEGDNDDQQ